MYLPEPTQTLINNEMETSNDELSNFQETVMEYIKKITNSIECTLEQNKIILSKSEEILNKHISRAGRGEITIPSYANALKNAVAIIYAVLVSNETMPNISQTELSKIADINQSAIAQLYNKYYKIKNLVATLQQSEVKCRN